MATIAGVKNLDWPLMRDNLVEEDLAAVRDFLSSETPPILTQSSQVAALEQEWSDWLGVKHSLFVNSGSSANLITLAALRWASGPGEIIVSPLTWVSDIAAVLQNDFTPVFVDIDPETLGADTDQVIDKLCSRTRAVFLTHVLGYNALTEPLLRELERRDIPLIEDVCESHGAEFQGRKLGSFGLASNFSFYYAHHMSTVEGGMVCTNDADVHQRLRMLRSHGMVRESGDDGLKAEFATRFPDLHPEFIFAYPAYNVRNTEINAVMGRSQLRRLDQNNEHRRRHLRLFLAGLDPNKYFTTFREEGSCNYALTLLLKVPNEVLRDNVIDALGRRGVDFRRGMSGGGNQLRQPYLRERFGQFDPSEFPAVEHVHFFGFYLGNYPNLEESKIEALCGVLNRLPEHTRLG